MNIPRIVNPPPPSLEEFNRFWVDVVDAARFYPAGLNRSIWGLDRRGHQVTNGTSSSLAQAGAKP